MTQYYKTCSNNEWQKLTITPITLEMLLHELTLACFSIVSLGNVFPFQTLVWKVNCLLDQSSWLIWRNKMYFFRSVTFSTEKTPAMWWTADVWMWPVASAKRNMATWPTKKNFPLSNRFCSFLRLACLWSVTFCSRNVFSRRNKWAEDTLFTNFWVLTLRFISIRFYSCFH